MSLGDMRVVGMGDERVGLRLARARVVHLRLAGAWRNWHTQET